MSVLDHEGHGGLVQRASIATDRSTKIVVCFILFFRSCFLLIFYVPNMWYDTHPHHNSEDKYILHIFYVYTSLVIRVCLVPHTLEWQYPPTSSTFMCTSLMRTNINTPVICRTLNAHIMLVGNFVTRGVAYTIPAPSLIPLSFSSLPRTQPLESAHFLAFDEPAS